MKAWEMEHALMAESRPHPREEDEQTWSVIDQLERQEDASITMLWYNEVPGSGAPERLMVAGVQALENRGMKVEGWEDLLNEGFEAHKAGDMPTLHRVTADLWHAFRTASRDDSSEYWSYQQIQDWSECEASARFPETVGYNESGDAFRARLHAGWQAQIAGGALGTAIEGYTADALRNTLGDIRGYLVSPNTFNDDITFELAFLKAAEEKGASVTGADIAEKWVSFIPFAWSAELVALRNIRIGFRPPESGSFNNPFSEWIGAQMRGAVCGMVAPGNAREAARLAWLDGEISHIGNGILGEVFNAILVSRAFVDNDIRSILETAVGAMPPDSEYASVVSFALEECRRDEDWLAAWKACEQRYQHYNWVHAYPNACAEVIALWFGNGDFDETMHIVAMEGQDVDCNAAQIATVLGVAGGPAAIPAAWTDPIGDNLQTYVRTMKRLSIRELADWTARVAGR